MAFTPPTTGTLRIDLFVLVAGSSRLVQQLGGVAEAEFLGVKGFHLPQKQVWPPHQATVKRGIWRASWRWKAADRAKGL